MSELKDKIDRNHFMSEFQFIKVQKVENWPGVRFEIVHCRDKETLDRFKENPHNYHGVKSTYFVINYDDMDKIKRKKKLIEWALVVTPFLRLVNAKQKYEE